MNGGHGARRDGQPRAARPAPVSRRSAGRLATGLAALGVVLAAGSAVPAAEPARPLLVSVDDLPVAGRHDDPAERLRITEGLLAALARHRVPAVGMVTWSRVSSDADRALLDRWLDAGHELGNHSDRHLSYTTTDVATYLADIETARVRLHEFLAARGRAVRLFRFPFLREGDTPAKLEAMRSYLRDTAQRNLVVTIDDQDWSFEAPWVEARRAGDTAALERIGDEYLAALRLSVRHHERRGDAVAGRRTPQILLLHANEVGAANWDRLFTWLEATGHRFAGPDEVLADPLFADLPAVVSTHGFGLWDRMWRKAQESEARAEIEALLRERCEAAARGDVGALAGQYAEDAALAGGATGREAVRASLDGAGSGDTRRAVPCQPQDWRFGEGIEVTLLGDAAPSRVHAVSVVVQSPADSQVADGLLVFHRTQSGWEIVQEAVAGPRTP